MFANYFCAVYYLKNVNYVLFICMCHIFNPFNNTVYWSCVNNTLSTILNFVIGSYKEAEERACLEAEYLSKCNDDTEGTKADSPKG